MKNKDYLILFCFAFTSFLLCASYSLLMIVVVSKISYLCGFMLLISMISSIYFIIKYQYMINKEITKKVKKKKRNKVYNLEANKKYNHSLKRKKVYGK